MAEPKLSGRQIMEMFYTEEPLPAGCDGSDGKVSFRCRCGKVRAQSLKHGYTNLKQHVALKHPEWLMALREDSVVGPAVAVALRPAASSVMKKVRAPKPKQEPAVPSAVAAAVTATAATTATTATTSTTTVDAAAPPAVAAATGAVATTAPQKRADYLSWDDYFMSVAFLSAMRSKDPSTQVGACIVSPEKKIVGIGYNGFPNGCSDDELPWARSSASGSPLDTKYPYVCHAEMNAILNKNSTDVKGCTIYVALFPCNECAKLIIQSGISRVVYYSDKYSGDWKFAAARRLLDMAQVTYHKHNLKVSELMINFSSVV